MIGMSAEIVIETTAGAVCSTMLGIEFISCNLGCSTVILSPVTLVDCRKFD